jgi:hypothetical protein
MPNSIDAGLVVNAISERAQKTLANRLASLSLFSSDFSDAVKKPKETVNVRLVTAGSTTQTNPIVFNDIGGGTEGTTAVALDHIYQPFGVSIADMQSGHKLDHLIDINLDALADKIWALVTANITVANYGAATVTPATITTKLADGDLSKLWASVSKSTRKGLVVSPTIYSNLIPTSTTSLKLEAGSFGFDQGIYYANQFAGQTRLVGFACSPEAIAVASASPELDHLRGEMLAMEQVVLEQLGITVFYNVMVDRNTRALIASAELMFGSAKGITSGTMGLIVAAA